MKNNLGEMFLLQDENVFLNHGSFGACPKVVFDGYQEWQKLLEKQPVKFLTSDLYNYLENSRHELSEFVGCQEDEIAFFQNPTHAISCIIQSLDLNKGDEILMTNHEYGALIRAWTEWGKQKHINIIQNEIPIPVDNKDDFIRSFLSGITSKTKIIFMSHITSSTALKFPVKEIISAAKDRGIITIIDGAHVPGHIPLDINDLNCDFYTGACHKWLCAPKGASFLFVKKEHQKWIRPHVYSWGKKGDDPSNSEFLQDFQWQGTRDMSAFLTIPIAIKFYHEKIQKHQNMCKEVIKDTGKIFSQILGTEPIYNNDEWIEQMVSHKLPDNAPQNLKKILWNDYKIEIPIFEWNNCNYIRLSFQVYNSQDDIELLLHALKSLV